MLPRLLQIVLLASLPFSIAQREDLILTPASGWTISIDRADLYGGGGTPLQPTYLSNDDGLDMMLEVTGRGNSPWCVSVQRTEWLPATTLELSVEWMPISGNISGAAGWLHITAAEQTLITGRGDAAVSLNYLLTGVDLSLPANPVGYVTTVNYLQIQGC